MKVSLVIPLFNEEESLPELFSQIEAVMAELDHDYEYLFVDDGSTDTSLSVLEDLAGRSSRVNILSFRRNCGKSAALDAGFRNASGDVVITMDADLQDDPREIPNLLARIKAGADLVSGWKKTRHDPISKTLPSKLFNAVTSRTSGIKLHDFNCGLKAYRAEVVKNITVYGELHRFIPVLAGWEGYRVEEMEVQHHARKYGHSKYGARRLINGFFDLVTVMFVTRRALNPLHFFGRVAGVLFALGVVPQIYFLVMWLAGEGLRVRPIMLLGFVFIIVALQIASIGLLAELISARTARETIHVYKRYLVRGRDESPASAEQ